MQRQLVDRDLPRLVEALEPLLGRRPTFAMLKGRGNYLCLHRLRSGEQAPDEEDALFVPTPTSKAGRDVLRRMRRRAFGDLLRLSGGNGSGRQVLSGLR